jgi:ERF superfamily
MEVGTMLDLRENGAALVPTSDSPNAITQLLSLAIDRNVPVETIEKLMALHERMADRTAAQEFAEAMTAFRTECPTITKTQENTQFKVTRSGVTRAARYAPLEEIDRVARPVAARHGLTWTWDTRIEGELSHVSCRVAHIGGHSETTNVSMPFGSNAGSSPQQKYGTAQSYGMRYSLIAAMGITTADEDVDGAAADSETISEAQLSALTDMVTELDLSQEKYDKFLDHMKVDALKDVRASDYEKAANVLKEWKRQRAGKR